MTDRSAAANAQSDAAGRSVEKGKCGATASTPNFTPAYAAPAITDLKGYVSASQAADGITPAPEPTTVKMTLAFSGGAKDATGTGATQRDLVNGSSFVFTYDMGAYVAIAVTGDVDLNNPSAAEDVSCTISDSTGTVISRTDASGTAPAPTAPPAAPVQRHDPGTH